MLEPSDYWGRFADQLRDLGVHPTLIGGVAAARWWVRPRFTTDADFLCREDLRDLATAMEADGYSVRTMTQPGETDPYVLFIRGKGMQAHIERWADEWEVADRWAEARTWRP